MVQLPNPSYRVDIEVYDEYGDDHWAQAKYLAHSLGDTLWTNDFDEAINFIRSEVSCCEIDVEPVSKVLKNYMYYRDIVHKVCGLLNQDSGYYLNCGSCDHATTEVQDAVSNLIDRLKSQGHKG